MILDGHMHIWSMDYDGDSFYRSLEEAGVDGGCIMSIPPDGYMPTELNFKERISSVLELTGGKENLYPFFFLDPTEKDARDQVEYALDAGIKGFKIICYSFYPADPRAIKLYRRIGEAKKPILFHSGILYNKAVSADYCRPFRWEPLSELDEITFALAHVSWPWCDECIAVYGKSRWLSRYRERNGITSSYNMYIDLTPGTPPIYRKDVLEKLTTLYEDTLSKHIIFGTDNSVNKYKPDYTREIMDRDNGIYDELEVSIEFRSNIYSRNLLNFLRPGEENGN
jgi:predicted TIM-barrel fold metal-dependent hydrolase